MKTRNSLITCCQWTYFSEHITKQIIFKQKYFENVVYAYDTQFFSSASQSPQTSLCSTSRRVKWFLRQDFSHSKEKKVIGSFPSISFLNISHVFYCKNWKIPQNSCCTFSVRKTFPSEAFFLILKENLNSFFSVFPPKFLVFQLENVLFLAILISRPSKPHQNSKSGCYPPCLDLKVWRGGLSGIREINGKGKK